MVTGSSERHLGCTPHKVKRQQQSLLGQGKVGLRSRLHPSPRRPLLGH
jgi:hypothetical protein